MYNAHIHYKCICNFFIIVRDEIGSLSRRDIQQLNPFTKNIDINVLLPKASRVSPCSSSMIGNFLQARSDCNNGANGRNSINYFRNPMPAFIQQPGFGATQPLAMATYSPPPAMVGVPSAAIGPPAILERKSPIMAPPPKIAQLNVPMPVPIAPPLMQVSGSSTEQGHAITELTRALDRQQMSGEMQQMTNTIASSMLNTMILANRQHSHDSHDDSHGDQNVENNHLHGHSDISTIADPHVIIHENHIFHHYDGNVPVPDTNIDGIHQQWHHIDGEPGEHISGYVNLGPHNRREHYRYRLRHREDDDDYEDDDASNEDDNDDIDDDDDEDGERRAYKKRHIRIQKHRPQKGCRHRKCVFNEDQRKSKTNTDDDLMNALERMKNSYPDMYKNMVRIQEEQSSAQKNHQQTTNSNNNSDQILREILEELRNRNKEDNISLPTDMLNEDKKREENENELSSKKLTELLEQIKQSTSLVAPPPVSHEVNVVIHPVAPLPPVKPTSPTFPKPSTPSLPSSPPPLIQIVPTNPIKSATPSKVITLSMEFKTTVKKLSTVVPVPTVSHPTTNIILQHSLLEFKTTIPPTPHVTGDHVIHVVGNTYKASPNVYSGAPPVGLAATRPRISGKDYHEIPGDKHDDEFLAPQEQFDDRPLKEMLRLNDLKNKIEVAKLKKKLSNTVPSKISDEEAQRKTSSALNSIRNAAHSETSHDHFSEETLKDLELLRDLDYLKQKEKVEKQKKTRKSHKDKIRKHKTVLIKNNDLYRRIMSKAIHKAETRLSLTNKRRRVRRKKVYIIHS